MAYIPPHKRHSKDNESSSPSPKPELLSPLFKKNLKFGSTRTNNANQRTGKIVYADKSISRWFSLGLDDNSNQFRASLHLQPVSTEIHERKVGEKPLALFNNDLAENSSSLVKESFSRSPQPPWDYIAESVLEDLVSCYEVVKTEMESQNLEEVRPSLVARFGKILFRGSHSVNQESVTQESVTTNLVSENTLRQLKRSFYTNVPGSYMEYILKEGAPKIGVESEEEKDVYQVKLSDTTRPDSTISCKCRVLKEHGKLQLYKIELNQVRHMVMDISCLEKNLDLRLMLCTKRIITALSDDDMKSIRDLISSAIQDPEVKGGLRWPLGKAASGDKFTVVGVWHTVVKYYKNPSLRLKIRDADRFDFRTSTGEASREISVMLKRVASKLQEQRVDMNLINDMLKDDLKLLWNNFLCCERFPR